MREFASAAELVKVWIAHLVVSFPMKKPPSMLPWRLGG
jgi:hypothetical protein